jgi:hypothetical protein
MPGTPAHQRHEATTHAAARISSQIGKILTYLLLETQAPDVNKTKIFDFSIFIGGANVGVARINSLFPYLEIPACTIKIPCY